MLHTDNGEHLQHMEPAYWVFIPGWSIFTSCGAHLLLREEHTHWLRIYMFIYCIYRPTSSIQWASYV